MVDALKLIAGEGCFFKLQIGGRYHTARYLYNIVQGDYIFCQLYGIVENALHTSEHGIQHLLPGGGQSKPMPGSGFGRETLAVAG